MGKPVIKSSKPPNTEKTPFRFEDYNKGRQYSGKPQFKKDERKCQICKRFGHTADTCYFRKESGNPKNKALGQALKTASDYPQLDPNELAKTVAKSVTETLSSVLKGPISNDEQSEKSKDTGATCIHSSLKDCCQNDGKVELQCGHKLNILSLSCESKSDHLGNVGNVGMPVCQGTVNGKRVSVLRDSGCSTAVIKTDLVNENQMTGDYQSCVLIDGTIKHFPLARIRIDSPYFCRETDVLCMAKPVYELIIGNSHGARDASDPDVNWEQSASVETHECQAVETRGQKAKREKPTVPLKVTSPISEVSPTEFLQSQKMMLV